MSNFKYAIIGKNWGNRIHKILIEKGKSSQIFDVNFRKINLKEFLIEIKNFIIKNNINILWLAIPPINQFEICKIAFGIFRIP